MAFTYNPLVSSKQIYVSNTDGSNIIKITNDENYENWWPKISPDRTKIIYYREPKGSNENYTLVDLMIYDVSTQTTKVLRSHGSDSWSMQGHAEWSPNGAELVSCGAVNSGVIHIFILNSESGAIKRQLTTTGGWNGDPAWSPNSAAIVFNRCVPLNCFTVNGNLDIYTMSAVDGSGITQLTAADSKDDYDPYFSPDGLTIMWLQQVNTTAWSGLGSWSIKKMTSNGASQSFLINDTNINSKPNWSLDGSKIYFHRIAPGESIKFRLFSILPDGTQLAEISPFGSYTDSAVGSISYPNN